MTLLVPAVVAALLSLPSVADALPLNAERAASPVSPVAAASYQSYPSMAVDAAGHALAIWRDMRLLTPACPQCDGLFASRIDESGKPLDPFGIQLLANVANAAIVSPGSDFVIIYSDLAGFWSQRVDANARFIGDRVSLSTDSGGFLLAAATDGRTSLALVQRAAATQALILDANGRVATTITLPATQQRMYGQPCVIVSEGRYHVLRANGSCAGTCSYWIEDIAIDDSGAIATRSLATIDSPWTQIAAAATDQGILVAWITDVAGPPNANERIDYEYFDRSGATHGPVRANALSVSSTSARNIPIVVWDGRSFLLLWSQGAGSQLAGARIAADGTLIDATPIVAVNAASSTYPQGFATGRFPDGTNIVAWSDAFDVLALTLRSANDVGSVKPQLVTYSAAQQRDVGVAGNTTVWLEPTATQTAIMADSGGVQTVVAPLDSGWLRLAPAASSNGRTSLVAWMESSGGVRVLARRLSSNGALLDGAPIVVADEAPATFSPYFERRALSIATDGDAFFVTWPNGSEVHGRRVGSNGSLLDAAPVIAARFDPSSDVVRVTSTVWTGAQWMIATTRTRSLGPMVSPAPTDDSIYLARVTRDGVPLDATSPILVIDNGLSSTPVAAAFDSGRVLLAWSRVPITEALPPAESELWTQLLDANGSNLQTGPQRVFTGSGGSLLDFDVAPLGNSFVAATSERAADGTFVIRGRRIDSGGNLIDATPFDVSPAGSNADEVSLSGSPHRLTVGYIRVAADAGYVERVFTRSADDGRRQRSVRTSN